MILFSFFELGYDFLGLSIWIKGIATPVNKHEEPIVDAINILTDFAVNTLKNPDAPTVSLNYYPCEVKP